MNPIRLLSAALILAGATGTALAQTPLTRQEVKAQLAQALRDGDIEQGDSSKTLAEQFPQRYAAARVRDGETRYAMN